MLPNYAIEYRKKKLVELLHIIQTSEDKICEALYQDFKKPEFEAHITELFFVTSELKHTIKNINKWAKPTLVWPSLLNFPSLDYIYQQPYGNVLIISPWNYPFHLAMVPAIAAIAAGNQVVLKPSEHAPNTANVLKEIVSKVFDKDHFTVELGGVEKSQELLSKKWDYIFFTGSTTVGKIVAEAAAKSLTPVTLELGGKNPCIVDNAIDVKLAAKRIVWGKFLNGGQTCVAPDFVVVHENIKSEFITHCIAEINNLYGENPKESPDLCRIINEKNWSRLVNLLQNLNVLYGGNYSKEDLYIAPTLVDEPDLQSELMQEEIFGPILPVLSFTNYQDIQKFVSRYTNSLSFYVFSQDTKFVDKVLTEFSFGGGSVNDTLVHLSNNQLPFGGIGKSGIGHYHGKYGFSTFSHQKSISKKGTWLDISLRYPPYEKKLTLLKKILRWF